MRIRPIQRLAPGLEDRHKLIMTLAPPSWSDAAPADMAAVDSGAPETDVIRAHAPSSRRGHGPLAPGLYVVATPIGNLRDLTFRALDVLRDADLVLAEDTRVTAKLLSAYGLSKRVERYDDHADDRQRDKILGRLAAGERIALVSDAGTPLISDPGYRLVAAALGQGASVTPLPGASAALAALAGAGLPTDRFLFLGFTPPRSGARRAMFEEVAGVRATLIFYETGPRLADSLADMLSVFGPRPAAVCRELTKLYETFVRGSLDVLAADPALASPRGEIVVLVAPGREAAASADETDRALLDALARLSPADASREVAKALGLPRRTLYQRALALRSGPPEGEA
jgi:16S rRNA (cytidine1402-2'-O)-methyltransferase